MEERKERKRLRAEANKFKIDPISEKKVYVDKNPFRKKPLPKVISPLKQVDQIQDDNDRDKSTDLNLSQRSRKKTKIGTLSKKNDALLKASK